jgi:hypothetical protein
MSEQQFIIKDFTALVRFAERSSVVGIVPTVQTRSGFIFHDVVIHERNGRYWATPGTRPLLGPNGRQIVDHKGKRQWCPVISFASDDLRNKFSDAVISALRVSHPQVFGE